MTDVLSSMESEHLRRGRCPVGNNLPFTDVLSETTIGPALDAIEASCKNRIDSPLVSLWVCLSQILSSDQLVLQLTPTLGERSLGMPLDGRQHFDESVLRQVLVVARSGKCLRWDISVRPSQ